VLPVAVKTVRLDRTTLLVRDALCLRRLSSLRRLLLRLRLRRGLLLSMLHGEASRGRFSAHRAVAASDFRGVSRQSGEAVTARLERRAATLRFN
jgi:hypothetical protein